MAKKKTTVAERQGDYMQNVSENAKFYLAKMKKSEPFKKCSPRERLFIVNYVNCLGDIKMAMKQSGMSTRYYSKEADKILKKVNVQRAIRIFFDELFEEKISMIPKALIDQLYRRAFTPRSRYFNEKGELKRGLTLDDLGPDECIIDDIERKYYGKDADVEVIVYKLADRTVAYRELIKLCGLSVKKVEVKGQTSGVLKVPGTMKKVEWEKLN